MGHELSFCELRSKQVVNVIDGKVLGRIVDVVFSRQSARVLGFVVPGEGGFAFFKKRGDIFIPFERVCKIGVDVVLVELKPFHHGSHELLEHGHGHGHSHHSNPFAK
ncbi:MAG: YlmC/YmxH family sporulation protein [Firmicutes bacterium]|nr:YlmC/YmxH family sporulation protein [Bacillota bacterium]